MFSTEGYSVDYALEAEADVNLFAQRNWLQPPFFVRQERPPLRPLKGPSNQEEPALPTGSDGSALAFKAGTPKIIKDVFRFQRYHDVLNATLGKHSESCIAPNHGNDQVYDTSFAVNKAQAAFQNEKARCSKELKRRKASQPCEYLAEMPQLPRSSKGWLESGRKGIRAAEEEIRAQCTSCKGSRWKGESKQAGPIFEDILSNKGRVWRGGQWSRQRIIERDFEEAGSPCKSCRMRCAALNSIVEAPPRQSW